MSGSCDTTDAQRRVTTSNKRNFSFDGFELN